MRGLRKRESGRKEGEIKTIFKKTLSQVPIGNSCRVVAVKDNSVAFLQYVAQVGLGINEHIKIVSKQPYDALTCIEVNGKQSSVSEKFTDNIFVVCSICELGEACEETKCEIKLIVKN